MAKKTIERILFTVADYEAPGKPTLHAELIPAEVWTNQKAAEDVVRSYMTTCDDPEIIEDVAYALRKEGYYFIDEQFCYEFTRLCKPGEIIGE